MRAPLKPLALAVGLSGAVAMAATADGIDQIYDMEGNHMGEIEILGDVTMPNGVEYALFAAEEVQMFLFVDPDGVYVMMEEDNPVFTERRVYDGVWVSTEPVEQTHFPRCRSPLTDDTGAVYPVHGTLKWTNYGIAPNGYQIEFEIELGVCEDIPGSWAYSAARMGYADDASGEAPANDLPPLDVARDTCGNEDDLELRAIGCSDMIANPEAGMEDVKWAYWSRAYVRCGRAAPNEDIVADLMAMTRIDVADAQGYFQGAGGYAGPIDGQLGMDLYDAIVRYVEGGC